MDIKEINEMIQELEESDTTYDNAVDLASLYTVRDNITIDQLDDILPAYNQYCKLKREYQFNKIAINPVLLQLKRVGNEVIEFVQTMYSNTDTPEERKILREMTGKIKNSINLEKGVDRLKLM